MVGGGGLRLLMGFVLGITRRALVAAAAAAAAAAKQDQGRAVHHHLAAQQHVRAGRPVRCSGGDGAVRGAFGGGGGAGGGRSAPRRRFDTMPCPLPIPSAPSVWFLRSAQASSVGRLGGRGRGTGWWASTRRTTAPRASPSTRPSSPPTSPPPCPPPEPRWPGGGGGGPPTPRPGQAGQIRLTIRTNLCSAAANALQTPPSPPPTRPEFQI